jgi:hypothetical protein
MNDIKKNAGLIGVDDNIQRYLKEKNLSQADEVVLSISIIDYFDRILLNYDYIHSVFIYFESGKVLGVNGKSLTYNRFHSDTEAIKFFNSDIYYKAKGQYSKMIWEMGDENLFFGDESKKILAAQKTPMFTAAKALRALQEVTQDATIVINVYENVINDTYRYFGQGDGFSTYILDEKGRIISHNDQARIGTMETLLHEGVKGEQYGNFTMPRDEVPHRVIYYRMKDIGWTLISEIPVTEYLSVVNTLKLKILLILSVSMILSFLLSNIWMRRITNTLRTLTKSMDDIG